MFVLNPDQYLLPDYKISPFQTADMRGNSLLPDDDFACEYFTNRFSGRGFMYTYNGRSALRNALLHYKFGREDVVTILTTSGNLYISGCVTREIEKVCQWNREINENSKAILVVHEFGYPYKNLAGLRSHNLPIIEDVAYAFYSDDSEGVIGRVGDFVIYSFPKMFPVQIGGLLVYQDGITPLEEHWPEPWMQRYIARTLSRYLRNGNKIVSRRRENYVKLRQLFAERGCVERFQLEDDVVPGVFMFRIPNRQIDLQSLKTHFAMHGVQCSVFYGEKNSFFLPVHQRLEDYDLEYFAAVFDSFQK